MKKKKLLSWLLTMLMVLMMLPFGAFSALATETDPAPAVPTDKDLAKFLTAAAISGADKDQDGTYTVEADKEYGIALTFLETDKLQFADDVLELALPKGDGKVSWKKTAATDTAVKFKSGADELTINGNKLAVDENGKLTVSWNKDDVNYTQFTATNNVTFSTTVTATFAESLQGSSVSLFDGKLKAQAETPAPAEYQVSVDGGISNGAVTVSAESAVEGTKITVHVDPDADYELESVTMTPEGGSAQDITGALEFSMPASNVTVTASFKAVGEPEEEQENEPEDPDENLENQPDGNGQQGGESQNQPGGNGQQGQEPENQLDGNGQQGQEPENQPGGNGQQGQNNNNATEQPVNTEQGNQSGQTTPPENTENQNRSNNTVIMQHTIEVVSSSEEAGRVSGGGSYQTDDDVTVEATANDGFTFAGWTTEDGKEVSKEATYSFKASSDLKLIAVFRAMMRNTPPSAFTVDFNTDGGTPVPENQTVLYGQSATQPDKAPEKAGFSFDGWFKDADCTEVYDFTSEVKDNITIYAKWIPVPVNYTVTFNTNGGSEVKAQPVENGKTVPKPADPTRAGYTFVGWFSDEALTKAYDFSTPVTSDITLYAKWTPVPKTFTVTFDTDGGSAVDKQSVKEGDKAVKPAKDPTKKDYIFAGWVTAKGGSEAYKFDTPVTKDITIYAKWTPDSWTVKFDANGGSGSIDAVKVKKGEKLTLPESKFTAPAGKTFDKWTVGAPGTQIDVNDNLIIKAIWKDRTYTVEFYTNGGTKIPSQTVKHGGYAEAPSDEPTKTGFEFDGWFADSKFSDTFDFENTPITADTTIYAKWEQNPTPAKVTYSFANNKNSTYTYTKGSGKAVTITVKRSEDNDDCFEHFTGVRIDGKALGTNDYIAKSGSTIVTIKATTLEKLATGDHTVTIRFDDGTADAKLKVNKASAATSNSTANRTSNSTANRTSSANSPRTGDESHAGLWIAAVVVSALVVCGLVIARKKKSSK